MVWILANSTFNKKKKQPFNTILSIEQKFIGVVGEVEI